MDVQKIIETAEQIKNFPEKIKYLLSDDIINALLKTRYIYNLYWNSNEMRKKIFKAHPNFYKALTPGEIYEELSKEHDEEKKLNFLLIPNIIEKLTSKEYLSKILDTFNDKKVLKKILINPKIYKKLSEDNNIKFYLIFLCDKEVINFLSTQNITNRLKEIIEKNNLLESKLNSEEYKYLLLNANETLKLKLLKTKNVKIILKGDRKFIIKIYKKLKKESRLNLITSNEYIDIISSNISDILTICDKEEIKIILNNKKLEDKISESDLNFCICNDPQFFKEIIDNEEITQKISSQTLKNMMQIMRLLPNSKQQSIIVHYLFSKNIIKKIRIVDLAQIMRNFNHEQQVEILEEILKTQKIHINKVILLLDKLNLDESKNLLKKYYNIDENINNLIKKITNDICNIFNKILINENELEMLNILKEDIKYDDINIEVDYDQIISKLVEHSYIETSEIFFEMLLTVYINKKLKQKYENINFISDKMNEKTLGIYTKNTIKINSQYFKRTFFENIGVFMILSHELTHYKQSQKVYKETYDYNILKQVKDEILKTHIKKYYSLEKNYHVSNYECEAMLSEIKTKYFILKKIYKEIPTSELEKLTIKVKQIIKRYKKTDRIFQKNELFSLERLFDETVKKEEIAKYIKKYPVLLLEYNEDGLKKSLVEIIELYSLTKRKFLNKKTSQNAKVFMFYKKLLDDIMLKNQKHISNNEYINILNQIKILTTYNSIDEIFNEKKKEIIDYVMKITPSTKRIYKKAK